MSKKEFGTITIPSTTIASGSSFTTDVMSMASKEGMFSVYLEVTGDGDLEVEELVCVGGEVWKPIESRDSLAEALTDASGDGADGIVVLSPATPIGYCNSMKLRFSATSDSVTIEGNVLFR